MKVYCETFHGGMEQDDRERALYKFRNGSCHIFISTDLAARGLDIPDIKMLFIIIFQLQKTGLYTGTDVRHAGKLMVVLTSFFILKNSCLLT